MDLSPRAGPQVTIASTEREVSSDKSDVPTATNTLLARAFSTIIENVPLPIGIDLASPLTCCAAGSGIGWAQIP